MCRLGVPECGNTDRARRHWRPERRSRGESERKPRGVPKFSRDAKGDPTSPVQKCTFCGGGPKSKPFSKEEFKLYGQNRIAEGKPPLCSSMCATKALLGGDKAVIEAIYKKRVAKRS